MNKSILFVCLGNICRSPTAEGVFRKLSLEHPSIQLEIDSCGTSACHIGECSDPRSVAAAKTRGYDLSSIRSRKIVVEDFKRFDYILAMDNSNLDNLRELAELNNFDGKNIHLFLDYSKQSITNEVSDPYYGGINGFDKVIDLVEDASRGLIRDLLSLNN